MRGFSVCKSRWWTFLILGLFIMVIIPIFALAQTGAGQPPAEEVTGEKSTGSPETALEGEGMPEGMEPLTTGEAVELLNPGPPPEPVEMVKYHYFILHSTDPELPIEEWDMLADFPADESYTWEQRGYFSNFFSKDPNPKKPMEPVEPTEPVKPLEKDFPVKDLYTEAVNRYHVAQKKFAKDVIGFKVYSQKYSALRDEYNKKLEAFDANTYPKLDHYFFYDRTIPPHQPKKSVYKITVKQAVKPTPPPPEAKVEEAVPAPEAPIAPAERKFELPKGVNATDIFNYNDRPNDSGGFVALLWGTSPLDREKEFFTPEPEPAQPAEEEKPAAEKKEPEYEMQKFDIDAWVFAPTLVSEADIETLTVVADLSSMGGDKATKMDFVGIVDDDPKAFDYNLGLHYHTTFASPLDDKSLVGRHFIKVAADSDLLPKRLTGKIRVNKIAGEPVDAIQNQDAVPDMYYQHYFKLGIDYWDHKGTPRMLLEAPDKSGGTKAVIAKSNFWNWASWNTQLFGLLFTIGVLFFIYRARSGASLFVRRIPGLDHVEEAIGRATEMGKPILFVPGIGTMSDVATIAAMNILGQVARKVAEYDSRIIVPNKDPIVMSVAQEVTEEGFIDAGHPDKYNKDDIFFLTDDQFSFTAAVDGIMVRDKPATNLLMGTFYAESLILAETGASTGAIQIAGTDMLSQLPFFITACDYTLIGEELYAASAYLSREPLLLGSLKGQDLAKAFFFIIIPIGVVLATFGWTSLSTLFSSPI